MELKAPEAAGRARPAARRASCRTCAAWTCSKKPGIAETLDWAAALLRLGIATIDDDGAERIVETLRRLIKTREDRAGFTREVVARIAAGC